jgi:hypothetical protein
MNGSTSRFHNHRQCHVTNIYNQQVNQRASPKPITQQLKPSTHCKWAIFTHCHSYKIEAGMYNHQVMGSPPQYILLVITKNHPKIVTALPGLTYNLTNKQLLISTATVHDHMIHNKEDHGQCTAIDTRWYIADMEPSEQVDPRQEDGIFSSAIVDNGHDSMVYSEMTGWWPVQWYKGMMSTFFAYVCKLNNWGWMPIR